MKQKAPAQEPIAERAYSLWEQAGRPTGRDEEFWLRAEAELAAPASASSVPPVIPPPPASAGAPPPHDVPPAIKSAVTTADRRPTSRRAPKRG